MTTTNSPALFRPFTIGSLELANRIVVSPMCQYSAVDGNPGPWHHAHLGGLAMSGASLVFVEATAVESTGRISPGDTSLCTDDNERAFSDVLRVMRAAGPARVGIQLAHAGRKSSCGIPWHNGGKQLALDDGGWMTNAPSAIPFNEGERAPEPLDEKGLLRVMYQFVEAAGRAVRIGFDVIELHFAHGYLMHEFLSPLSNKRTDFYGGTLENRMRFPLRVFEAVRDVVDSMAPNKIPVGVRVSSTDWVDGGWDIESTVAFAREIKKRGCDFVDCSSGAIVPNAKVPVGPGYQVPFAKRVRAEAGIATIAVGMITTAEQANAIVDEGSADLCAFARAMLWDPRFGWHAAEKLGVTIAGPVQARLGNPKVITPWTPSSSSSKGSSA